MSLSIRKGPQKRAYRTIIYGPEGIGKSTLASKFPNAVFIDYEHGTDTMDVARFETPSSFEETIYLLNSIAQEDICKTVILDTADKLEQIITKYVCDSKGLKSIEDAGYGKGYTYLLESWIELLKVLDKVIESGKNVVLVAHAQMRKFEQPDEMGAYDRWELKLSKKTAPIIKEWADMLLFCNYKTTVTEDPKTKSKKAVGGKRVMYATHSPVYDAKNRFGLPDSMEMDFEEIAHVFSDVPEKKSIKVQIKEALESANITEDKVIYFLRTQDPSLEGEVIDDLNAQTVEWIYKNLTKLIKKLTEEEK